MTLSCYYFSHYMPYRYRWQECELNQVNRYKGITPFIKLLDNKELRRLVFWALMKIRDPNATELLISAIADEDENIRCLAVHSLGEFGDKRARIPLSQLNIENDSYFRERVEATIVSIHGRLA